jgi:hypothetical protein
MRRSLDEISVGTLGGWWGVDCWGVLRGVDGFAAFEIPLSMVVKIDQVKVLSVML